MPRKRRSRRQILIDQFFGIRPTPVKIMGRNKGSAPLPTGDGEDK